jgi:RNA exonuclease 1
MGTTKDGETELIRVTLLDYFTGAALVDSLVYPDVTIDNYNTRYSGVTYGMMIAAKKRNNCFFGRDNARKAVWEYVGPDTIVIGHSAYNDLKSMRWIHRHLVDSFLLEPQPVELVPEKDGCTGQQGEQKPAVAANGKSTSPGEVPTSQPSKPAEPSTLSNTPSASGAEAQEGQKQTPPKPKAPKGSGPRALKTLARVKLGREIQNAGRLGHDSFEDALAARDLVHWAVLDRRTTVKH